LRSRRIRASREFMTGIAGGAAPHGVRLRHSPRRVAATRSARATNGGRNPMRKAGVIVAELTPNAATRRMKVGQEIVTALVWSLRFESGLLNP
jgi:hypothetical protein